MDLMFSATQMSKRHVKLRTIGQVISRDGHTDTMPIRFLTFPKLCGHVFQIGTLQWHP
jgi:hypothetical protein